MLPRWPAAENEGPVTSAEMTDWLSACLERDKARLLDTAREAAGTPGGSVTTRLAMEQVSGIQSQLKVIEIASKALTDGGDPRFGQILAWLAFARADRARLPSDLGPDEIATHRGRVRPERVARGRQWDDVREQLRRSVRERRGPASPVRLWAGTASTSVPAARMPLIGWVTSRDVGAHTASSPAGGYLLASRSTQWAARSRNTTLASSSPLITWVQADLGSVLHAAHDVEAEPGRERRGGVLAGRMSAG
jgi:hypothetical protein